MRRTKYIRKRNRSKKNIITRKKIQKGGLFITKSKINSLNEYFRNKYDESNFLEWYNERENSRTKYNYFTRRTIDGYRKLYEINFEKFEKLKLATNYYEDLFSKNNISQEELEEIIYFFRRDFYEPIIIPRNSYRPTIELNHKIKNLLISQLMILYNEKVINKDTFERLDKKIKKVNNFFQNNILNGNSSISSSRNSFNSSNSSNNSIHISNDIPDNITNERVESLLFGSN